MRLVPLLFLMICGLAQDGVDPDLPEHYESVSFSAVRIPVWVNDRKGLPVTDLASHQFRLFIDGKQVPIESFLNTWYSPVEMVYLIDLSGSMGLGGKLKGSIETIDWMVGEHGQFDRWHVVAFSDGQIVEVADSKNPERWDAVVPKLEAYGKTALFDTLAIANRFFRDDSFNNRALVVFTDGFDNDSELDEDHLLRVLQVLRVPVFVVAIGNGFAPLSKESEEMLGLQTLNNIATITGGTMFLAKGAQHIPVIGRTMQRQLRPQYLLSMTVEQTKEQQRHEIDVKLVRKSSYFLRYRRGYVGSVPSSHGGR